MSLPPPEVDLEPIVEDEGQRLDVERIRDALEKARWRRGEAAKLLGVSPRTLYRWMKKLHL